jgi:hypothetical protein
MSIGEKMTVRHIFLWSVKQGYPGEYVLKRLAELRQLVPGLAEFTIGKHGGETSNASTGRWEYALTVDFPSFEALDAYQAHPAHTALIEEVQDSYADWLVLDYTIG